MRREKKQERSLAVMRKGFEGAGRVGVTKRVTLPGGEQRANLEAVKRCGDVAAGRGKLKSGGRKW